VEGGYFLNVCVTLVLIADVVDVPTILFNCVARPSRCFSGVEGYGQNNVFEIFFSFSHSLQGKYFGSNRIFFDKTLYMYSYPDADNACKVIRPCKAAFIR